MLCNKLHCHKGFNLIPFSYKIIILVAPQVGLLVPQDRKRNIAITCVKLAPSIYLTQRVDGTFLESQRPHTIVNSLSTMSLLYNKLTVLCGGVTF